MPVQPATYNIRPQRRADYVLSVQFKDSTGTGINLTGWTCIAQVWDKERVNKYGDFTVTYVDRATGRVQLKLPYAITASLPLGGYAQYDVMLVNQSGLREYYMEGLVRSSEGYSTL
jgi:hypothetical protein